VWDEMMAERVRLYKERAKLQADIKNAKIKAQADLIDRALIFISFSAIAIPTFALSIAILSR
jgi:hypothetical protein